MHNFKILLFSIKTTQQERSTARHSGVLIPSLANEWGLNRFQQSYDHKRICRLFPLLRKHQPLFCFMSLFSGANEIVLTNTK